MGSEAAFFQPSLFSIEWQDVSPNEDTNLADSVTTVALTNETDAEAALVLRLVGDHGTTRTKVVELGEAIVGAGATVIVPVDLSALYSGNSMSYAGMAYVSANVMTDGIIEEHVVGDALYYNPADDGVVLYDEAQLMGSHASGDILNLDPEALSSKDPEDQATARILEFEFVEPEPIEDDLLVEDHENANPLPAQSFGASTNTAAGFQQKLCVRFEVDTIDSGFQSASGVTEDVWQNANNPVEYKANNIRVRIGSSTLDTNSSGCVTFTSPFAGTSANVRVYARADDTDGNYVRVHNGSPTTQASYPATTYSWYTVSVPFSSGTTTILPVGDHTPRATMMGAFARSLHRYSDGMVNSGIHVAEDSSGQGLNYNYYNNHTTSEAYVSILTTQNLPRTKFLISHEYGHAYLHIASNKDTPNQDDTLPLSGAGPGCTGTGPNNNGAPYHSTSEEWSSTAFTEGYAHFISARVWNHKASNGWFNFGGLSRTELENFDAASTPGGRMVNVCCEGAAACTPARDGHGNIFDWLRALWDMHHGGGGCSLNRGQMMSFFSFIVNSGASGPGRGEYYDVSEAVSVGFGTSCTNWWKKIACHNGINMDGSTWNTPC
ncbi:MAG: hypothetical protein ACRBN8_40860 [Nannocystales bacterium]